MANAVQNPETVAGHMYRMAMMCFLFKGTPSNAPPPSGQLTEPLGHVDREK